jgi:hypothetical protein
MDILGIKQRYYKRLEEKAARRTLENLKYHIKNDNDLILVHQMGRAASMTLTNTIRSMDLGQPVFHTHWLNVNSVKERVDRINGWKNSGLGPLNVRVSEILAPEIDKRLEARQWQLVSVIREPVARNVSAFFLDIDRFFNDFSTQYKRGNISLDQMQEVFLDEFPHEMPLDWFEREVEEPFGINIFKTRYDESKGYSMAKKKNISLLVIKLDKLNDCYKSALHEFFGKKPKELVNTHVTNTSSLATIYKEFIANAHFPESYLDRMYDCKYARHFYSETEINNFREKWSRKSR